MVEAVIQPLRRKKTCARSARRPDQRQPVYAPIQHRIQRNLGVYSASLSLNGPRRTQSMARATLA